MWLVATVLVRSVLAGPAIFYKISHLKTKVIVILLNLAFNPSSRNHISPNTPHRPRLCTAQQQPPGQQETIDQP